MSDDAESIDPRFVEEDGDETSIRLHAGGWERFFDGSLGLLRFLIWSFAEGFLASQLLAATSSNTLDFFAIRIEPPPAWAAAGILLFTALWTAVGVSMISSLLRLLLGSDQIVLTTSEIRVLRLVGPFGRERVFAPGRIDWVAIKGSKRSLFISVDGKERVIASLGTWSDRRFVAETLEKRYGLKTPSEKAHGGAPAGWELERSVDGFVSFRNRSTDRALIGCTGAISAVCWLIAVAGIIVRVLVDPRAVNPTIGDVLKFGIAVISTIVAYWAARASRFIRARRNEVVIELKFGPWRRRQSISDATLRVSFRTKGKTLDDVFALEAANRDKTTELCVRLNDATEVVALAQTLALQTGWNLEIAPQAHQA